MVKKNAKKIIKFRQELFWDVDPKTVDPRKNAKYIVERILEFGNMPELKWLFGFYQRAFIKKVFENSRGVLRNKTKALWSLILR